MERKPVKKPGLFKKYVTWEAVQNFLLGGDNAPKISS
jgi:hypothetical protein